MTAWQLSRRHARLTAPLSHGETARPFTATTNGPDKLDLRQTLEDFANEQWLPDHLDDEHRVEWVMDQFERTVAGELKLLGLELA